MRLICISDRIYSFLKKLEVTLPNFAWNAIYAPFPFFFLKNAQLYQLLKESTRESIPSRFRFEGAPNKTELSIVEPSNKVTTEYIIFNAVVLPNGAIIADGKILLQSSIFSKLSFSDYTEICNLFFKENRPVLNEAVFLPRLINRRGTYGDYFAEFLVPFAGHNVSKKMPILFDADFTYNSAISDLPDFGFTNLIRIPQNGLKVEKLHVKFPNHYFDNFLHRNIDLLRKTLPLSMEVKSPLKVYISRLGYNAELNNRNRRQLMNEYEVETFLKSRGFFILRSHEVSNKDSRILLRYAQMIVFNHGSGFVNSAWSSVRSVVEIGLSTWWNPFFLKLCHGMGVEKYSLLMAENGFLSINRLQAEIEYLENIV